MRFGNILVSAGQWIIPCRGKDTENFVCQTRRKRKVHALKRFVSSQFVCRSVILAVLMCPAVTYGQGDFVWKPGNNPPSDVNGVVDALTVYNGELIAGGYFITAGGLDVNYIARWDGSSWQSLGGGMNGTVFALTVYNDQLIAGGNFTKAGDVNADYIARWDGSSWQPLGNGMNGAVYALSVYDGQLIAGGGFTTAGGISANRIARWDDSTWQPLGSGMNGAIYALTVYNDQLIAGGNFYTAGGINANRIAHWDGGEWQPLGSGMNAEVRALTVYNSEVVAGGGFTNAGGVDANGIARWNGSNWLPLGSGTNNPVSALTVYDGELIAGGGFTNAGGVDANRIGRWDGSNWRPMGGGMNNPVYALTVYNGDLIAGGSFTAETDIVSLDAVISIEINRSKVAGELTNFQVVITEAQLPDSFWSSVKNDGSDLWLEDFYGTKLIRELVSIDKSSRKMELWVKVPVLSNVQDEVLYLHYGDPCRTGVSDANTWDPDFKLVQHLRYSRGDYMYPITADSSMACNNVTVVGNMNSQWTSIGNTSGTLNAAYQGVASDGNNYFLINSRSSGGSTNNWIKKYTREGNDLILVATDPNIAAESGMTSPPDANYWTHFGDGCVYNGYLYVPVVYWRSSDMDAKSQQVSVWDMNLNWVSNNPLGGSPTHNGSGLHFDGTNFYIVSFAWTPKTTIYVYDANYAHGTDITMSSGIASMEGITGSGSYFYICNSGVGSISQVKLDGTVLGPVYTNSDAVETAIEWLEPTSARPLGEIAFMGWRSDISGTKVYWLRHLPPPAGKIGDAVSFTCSKYFTEPHADVKGLDSATAFTFEIWGKLTFGGGSFFDRASATVPFTFTLSASGPPPSETYQLQGRVGSTTYHSSNTFANPTNAWHHYAMRWDGSQLHYYLDGNDIGPATDEVYAGAFNGDLNLGILSPPGGLLDEARISTVDRGTAWIQTCYNNQNDPNTFYTVSNVTLVDSSYWARWGLPQVIAGDLNHNGVVDWFDVGWLAENWLDEDCMYNGWCYEADLNYDFAVDFADFAKLGANWRRN